jgi:hypothetical protein
VDFYHYFGNNYGIFAINRRAVADSSRWSDRPDINYHIDISFLRQSSRGVYFSFGFIDRSFNSLRNRLDLSYLSDILADNIVYFSLRSANNFQAINTDVATDVFLRHNFI